jgi:hypothetical protein
VPSDFPDRLSPWTYAELDARSEVDPVNVIVRGAGVLQVRDILDRVELREVGNVERWSRRQFFSHRGNTHEADLSLGSGRDWLGWGRRTHLRLYQPPADPGSEPYTACTAHLDELSLRMKRCFMTEVGASFSKARADIERALAAEGYATRTIQTSTVGSVKQCDGRRTVVDGLVLLVDA